MNAARHPRPSLRRSCATNVGALVPALLDTIDVCHANASLLSGGSALHPDSCATACLYFVGQR